MTPFLCRKFGSDGRLYKSRITSREYVVRGSRSAGFASVFHNGRMVYGGSSLDRAFQAMELEDCL